MNTNVYFTFIGVQLAGPAHPASRTETAIPLWRLLACCPPTTWAQITLPHRLSTGVSSPAFSAHAAEACEVLYTAGPLVAGGRATCMLHDVTVSAPEPFLALTLVLVGLRVGTGAPVVTGLEVPTCVQVFVTEQSSPVDVTHTLPGLGAGPINTARVGHTLVTQRALPAIMTLAVSRDSTGTVGLVTPLSANRFTTLGSRPALLADLGAAGLAGKVSEEVVPGPAELVAEGPVVVGVAAEAEAVLQGEGGPVVPVGLPLLPGVQHGGQQHPLDQLTG